jgi:tetratricopeptide (TPR) repeat protein
MFARIDDVSVSFAAALGLECSEEQVARMRTIPTTSANAVAFYGKALTVPSSSPERGDLLRRALAEDARYTDALSKLGLHYYETGRLAKAQEVLQALAEVQPAYPHVYYNLGLVCRYRKHYSRAVEMYRMALAMEPHDPDAYNNLGATYSLMGMNEEAKNAFEKALEIDPNYSQARANLARLAASDTGASANTTPAAQATNRLKQHIESGAALYATGDFWRAIEEFEAALDIQPDNFKANNNIALAYMKIGQTEKAREHFKRALSADPTALDVTENLAGLDVPLASVNPSAEAAPSASADPQALCAAGNIYLARHSYNEAMVEFSRALAVSPDNVEALVGLGTAQFALADYEKARDQFKKALAVDPANEIAKKKLVDVEFVLSGSDENAATEHSFHLPASPELEARARFLRANELYEAGDYQAAVSEYLRAYDLAPRSTEILNNLATTYYQMQRYEEARATLEKARELDPKDEIIRENLGTLAAATTQSDTIAEMKRLPTASVNFPENIEEAPQPDPIMTPGIPEQQETAGEGSLLGDAEPSEATWEGSSTENTEATEMAVEESPAERIEPSLSMVAPEDGQKEAQVTTSENPGLNSPSAKTQFELGAASEAAGNLEEALDYYREATRLNPGDAIAHYNLGNIYFRLGALESAVNSYKDALEADPLLAVAHNNTGVALHKLGHTREATEAWQRALETDPTLESARTNLETFGVNE